MGRVTSAAEKYTHTHKLSDGAAAALIDYPSLPTLKLSPVHSFVHFVIYSPLYPYSSVYISLHFTLTESAQKILNNSFFYETN